MATDFKTDVDLNVIGIQTVNGFDLDLEEIVPDPYALRNWIYQNVEEYILRTEEQRFLFVEDYTRSRLNKPIAEFLATFKDGTLNEFIKINGTGV